MIKNQIMVAPNKLWMPRKPVGRPRTRWSKYIEDLKWNPLGFHPSKMMDVMEDREVWRLNLELLPPQPSRKSGQWIKKKIMVARKSLVQFAITASRSFSGVGLAWVVATWIRAFGRGRVRATLTFYPGKGWRENGHYLFLFCAKSCCVEV